MKKASKILFVALAAMLVSLFTGCELIDRIKEELVGPEKKWVSYTDYEYAYGKTEDGKNKSIYIDVYLMYSGTDYTNTNMKNLKDSDGKPLTTLPAGISILVLPSVNKAAENSSAVIKEVFDVASTDGDPFIYVTLDKGSSQEIEDDSAANQENKIKNFTVNEISWGILYNCVEFTNLGSKLPAPLSKDGDYQSFEASASNFSIKKLLGKLAISKLSQLIED